MIISRRIAKLLKVQILIARMGTHKDYLATKAVPLNHSMNRINQSESCLFSMDKAYVFRYPSIKYKASLICTLSSAFAAIFLVPLIFATQKETSSSARRKSVPLQIFSNDSKDVDACIIPDACINAKKDSHVVFVPLSHWKNTALLRRCLRREVELEFYDRVIPTNRFQEALRETNDFDVIGVPIEDGYFDHFPHLALELIQHVVVPASFFQRRNMLQPYCVEGNKFAACEFSYALKPRISLSLNVLTGTAKHWKYSFASMLANGSDRSLNLEQKRSQTFAHSSLSRTSIRCFRSMLTSPHPYNADNPEHFGLLRASGISRHINVSRTSSGRCKPHIVVITRDSHHHPTGRAFDRTIPERIIRALQELLFHELVEADLPFATVEFVTGLGNFNFTEQVAIMQRADVLVLVHGAELANSMFLRRGVTVIEVFPFGYHYPFFKDLLKAVGVKHIRIFAPPDLKRYKYCINSTSLLKFPHMVLLWGNRVLHSFVDKVREYERAQNDVDRDRAADFCSSYFIGRYCARTQRIFVDPVRLTRIVVNETNRVCRK